MATEKITVTLLISFKEGNRANEHLTEEYEMSMDVDNFFDAVCTLIDERHPGVYYGVMEIKDKFGQILWD